MGVGAGLYMYVVVEQKFTFAISSPDEFLSLKVTSFSSSRFLIFNQLNIVSVISNFRQPDMMRAG